MQLNIKDFLDESTAEAWKCDPTLPIILKISFSDVYYVETLKPAIAEFIQVRGIEKVKFGLAYQLASILNTYIAKFWPGLSKDGRYEPRKYIKPSKKETKNRSEGKLILPLMVLKVKNPPKLPIKTLKLRARVFLDESLDPKMLLTPQRKEVKLNNLTKILLPQQPQLQKMTQQRIREILFRYL